LTITNRYNLPAPLVAAVTFPWYQKVGHISATALLKSPRQRWLEMRHQADIVEDASDRIWALLGQAVHSVLDKSSSANHLTEERLRAVVNGWTITGQADLLDAEMVLTDYKVTSVWSFILDEHPDWEAQLNVYAWLFAQAGFTVQKARIVGILRDWQAGKAGQDKYPEVPVAVKWVELWDADWQRQFITGRVVLHQTTENIADDLLPPCTPEERWEKPTTYAVMKAGRKSAVRVFESRAEALTYVGGAPLGIVERPGSSMRCERYCNAAPFCNQWAAIRAEMAPETAQEAL
jgi:hypothetical protein